MQGPDLEPFLYYVSERWRIWERKEVNKQMWPWTDDWILREFSFTNIYRENDRVSREFRKLYNELREAPYLWQLVYLCRHINWPPTILAILKDQNWPYDKFDYEAARQTMLGIAAQGGKVYTGAYMIKGDATQKGGDKPHYTCYRVMKPFFEAGDDFLKIRTMEELNTHLRGFEGTGGFLAQECALDYGDRMSNIMDFKDLDTWAFAGPGAKRGLNRLLGRDVDAPMRQVEALELMRYISNTAYPILKVPRLTVHDVEFSLCEVDKYLRVKTGQGRPRSSYRRKETE